MKPHIQLSIRSILLLTIGGLTGIIAVLAAKTTYENVVKLERLVALKDASILSEQMFDAIEAFGVERDIALSMLRTSTPETPDSMQARHAESRKAADKASASMMASLQRYQFPELVELRQRMVVRLQRIGAVRELVDRDLAVPKEMRDASLQDRWSGEVSSLLAQTNDLWNAFISHFTDIDAVVTQHLRFKHIVRRLIEFSGRERSIIGGLLAEKRAPTSAEVSDLLRTRGGAESSWQLSRILADQSGLYPQISAVYSDALSHHATMHDMIQDIFYKPGEKAVSYPISVELWLELSTQASDSLVALRDAGGRETKAFVQKRIDGAEREIFIQSMAFGLALALCGYSFWMVVARVVNPIRAIADALSRAARGEEIEIPKKDRADEIGQLIDVLHAFNEAQLKIKRTALELDRSQSELRAVVDHAVDGLITIDGHGTIRSFNPACERIFGYRADEVLGRNITMLMPEPQDGSYEGLASLYRSLGEGHLIGGPGSDLQAKRKDGSIFPVDLSISAFMLEGEQHFSGIVRDITLRKQAEQQLMEHTRALERSNKELDDFAYIASHDLKEPLRGIHNHSRFLLEDNSDKLDQESSGRLLRLVYLSQRMERLVNDLLYFSRLGRQELAVQSTDLNAVVKDVEATLETFLEERGGRIVIPTPLPTIVCDKPRVTELLRNLITNAIKYNDKPERLVEIGCLRRHRANDGTTLRNVFYVKDDGRGIKPEFHQEIFRIFKRLQQSSEKEEGTGVGLTFVKKIVERHGGRIWLESEPGQGTTFFFTLEAPHHEHTSGKQAAA